MNHTHNRWILDKGEFVKRDFTVTQTGNGGIIAYLTRPVNEQDRGSVANQSDRVSFTTPVDFIEWLKGEYGVDTQITNTQQVDTWGDQLNADAKGPFVGAAPAQVGSSGMVVVRRPDGREDVHHPASTWEIKPDGSLELDVPTSHFTSYGAQYRAGEWAAVRCVSGQYTDASSSDRETLPTGSRGFY